jgi:hypothetical protein
MFCDFQTRFLSNTDTCINVTRFETSFWFILRLSCDVFQAAGLELKENLATGAATWPYPTVYHPYDAAAFAGYPFNG